MKRKWIWIVLGLLVAALLTAAFLEVLLPYIQARTSASPNGTLTIYQQEDGTLAVNWHKVEGADFYCVELFQPVEDPKQEPEILYREWIYGAESCVIPWLDPEILLTMRVTPGKDFEVLNETYHRYSESFMEVTAYFAPPGLTDLKQTIDPERDTLDVTFAMKQGDCCVVNRLNADGSMTEIERLTDGHFRIHFGANGDLPEPEWNQKETFIFSVERQTTGMLFYGLEAARVSLVGEDLLERELNLNIEDLSNNLYRLTWNETKGEFFEVQMRQDSTQDWATVQVITRDMEMSYESPQLEPFQHYEYRVAAVGGQTMKNSQYAAVSNELSVDTDASALYCTIWPTKNLEAYSDPNRTEVICTVTTGKAYCVLDEVDGMFAVMTGSGACYIDSNFCMINLPEYLGELCSYKITNSYSSKYLVHEYEMPKVSGRVIVGYEDIKQEDGSYLVPLLYPTSKMLREAALIARDHGYRLRIYDAYRPNEATVKLYDRMVDVLDQPIPEKTYTGKSVTLVEVEDPAELTYRLVMTNNKWAINNFLARGYSKHNLGVAVDLTLEKLEDGKEVKMQTSMHDLSWYSSRARNNDSAKVLSKIMTGAGFATLSSEWWHFQDNDSRENLDLAVVKNGVSGECWMTDGYGWRYRTEDGTYYADCTVTIDEIEYTFDAEGYLENV